MTACPPEPKAGAPAVWGLSRHSAGMHVRFITDATRSGARWTVTSGDLAMPTWRRRASAGSIST